MFRRKERVQMDYRDRMPEFYALVSELRRLQGGVRVSIEHVTLGRDYAEVESVLRQLDVRLESLIVRSERAAASL
jgi:hypothetical protein